MVIQAVLLVAVQLQPAPAVTLTDAQIKALTESIEDAVVAIGHYDKKLAALEKLTEKAKAAPESAKAA